MKTVLLVFLLLLTACEKQSFEADMREDEFYKCHVRVDLVWDNGLTYIQRNQLLDKFNKRVFNGGGGFFSMTLNNHDELIHFYVGDMDYRCPPKFEENKYRDVKKVLDKYLKPMVNSPKYEIYITSPFVKTT